MRLIAVDTETTGLKSKEGDRIIELAMVEITRDPNPRFYHSLFNPEGRPISASATDVHGFKDEDLLDAPLFRNCIEEIFEFIGDESTLVIHNAPFDLEFLRDECMIASCDWLEPPVIDTLKLAAAKFPGSRHSLDALCNRFGIDLSSRTKHGALIDTRLLAQLYLSWQGQSGFDLNGEGAKSARVDAEVLGTLNGMLVPMVPKVSEELPAPSWGKFFEGFSL